MFNYSKKVKIILSILLAVLIIGLAWFLIKDRSQTKDLELVAQVQNLATALEQYYDKFNTYPQSAEVDADQIVLITEQGLNKTGDIIYYQRQHNFVRPVTFLSSGTHYTIKFQVKNNWPIWQVQSGGGDCRLTSNMLMSCQAL